MRWALPAFCAALLAVPAAASAQQSVYRCTENGKTVYSSIPCPGGKVVANTNPAPAAAASAPVAKPSLAKQQEARAQGDEAAGSAQPGESADERDVREKRASLNAGARRECETLEQKIAGRPAEAEMYKLRKRYRDIRC
jgi:hypothetical protein